jgi:MFS transporter
MLPLWAFRKTSISKVTTSVMLRRSFSLRCSASKSQTVSFNLQLLPSRIIVLTLLVYLLQVVPAGKWLGLNVMLWGVATASGAAAHNYRTLLVSRVFLGIFEATIGPSLLLISSQWYTKSEQAPRFSFWYLGLGLGQILGGAVSYGFQKVEVGASLAGWRTMFVTLGVVTVVIGICTMIFLPDTPMKARWLSDSEKVALLKHVSVNQTGIQDRKFRLKEIIEAFCDPQIYLLVLAVILVRLLVIFQFVLSSLTRSVTSFPFQAEWLQLTQPHSLRIWVTNLGKPLS